MRVFAEGVNSSAQNGLTDYSSNYVDIPFEVQKLSQTAPTVASIPETIKGQANGKITDVTSAMEYRKEGDGEYTSISGNEITGLPAGTYFIRYKEDENHTASEETKVTIAEGRQLNITVPTEQTGYELTVDKDTADWHGEAKLTFKLKDGYFKTDEFAVMVNGEKVALDENGKYILVPKSGAYTIVVTDKAGNTTTIDNVTVNKEVPSVTEPTVSQETLTYDGTEQTLITAGQTTGGKLEYSLDGKNWSSELPTAKNAGTYDVRYRVAGDTDYQDVAEKTLTVTIAPKVIGITWSNTQFVYNGHTQQPTATATGILEGENCEIAVKGGQKAVGKYIATAAEVSNQNYTLPETGITTEFEIKAQKKPQNNNNSGNNNTAPEVNAKKKPLSDKHAKTFRYASRNKKIATVSKNGKIKAVAKGKCTIYVYARNGYTKKVQVTVK